jgi:hypothetical protein
LSWIRIISHLHIFPIYKLFNDFSHLNSIQYFYKLFLFFISNEIPFKIDNIPPFHKALRNLNSSKVDIQQRFESLINLGRHKLFWKQLLWSHCTSVNWYLLQSISLLLNFPRLLQFLLNCSTFWCIVILKKLSHCIRIFSVFKV